VFLRRLC